VHLLPAERLKEEGLNLFQRRAYDQALAKFEAAAHAYATHQDEAGRAEMLNNMGVIYRLQRNRTAAIPVLHEAESIFIRLGDLGRQAQVLGNLADLYAAGRNRNEAARCYSTAAALLAQSNEPLKQSQVLRALSLMRLRQGYWLEAMMRMEESLRVRPRISLAQRLFRALLRFALPLITGQELH
jgi:tetratricopeptide (TPR) repeat protein